MITVAAMHMVYRGVWSAAEPLVAWFVRRKDLRRGVSPVATAERFGYSSPPAAWQSCAGETHFTLWIHGASVGECLSALPIIELVLSGVFQQHASSSSSEMPRTRARVVLSTTTPAARELLRKRLAVLTGKQGADSDALCVFAPMDHPVWVKRFLDSWKPDAGLWIESELWPNLVLEAAARQIRIGVVNGRLSERSFQRWQLPLARAFAHSLVRSFSLVLCQNEANARRFRALGASTTDVLTNLKFAAQQVASDSGDGARLQSALAHRLAWVAVSTHECEELELAATHVQLVTRLCELAQHRDARLLTCIIPRHPERARAIASAIRAQYPDLEIAFRSSDSVPRASTSIFIVDTMGETALFFDAISTVFVGGTFAARGGHNPIEPLRAGCQVFVGPNMHNFEDIVEQIHAAETQLQGHDFAANGDADTRAPALLSPSDPARSDDVSPRAVQTVQDAEALARALQQHFATCVSPRSRQRQAMMQTLAVQSLRSHEHALLAWLDADSK